jgi:protein-disulfide isomerase
MSRPSTGTTASRNDDDASNPNEQAPEATQAQLAVDRKEAKRRRRRSRIAVSSAFGLVLLIAGGLAGFGYYVTHNKPSYQVPEHVAKQRDGIVAGGSGPVRVDLYVDYGCRSCKEFEAATGAILDQMVASNAITLVYHPLALAQTAATAVTPSPARSASRSARSKGRSARSTAPSVASSPRSAAPSVASSVPEAPYALRAAASVACASNLGDFLTYSNLLFHDQPKNVAGLTDNQLIQVGGMAGMINPAFAECLRAGTYDTWVAKQNAQAAQEHITSAPTVLVNGVAVAPAGTAPTLAELTAAIG